MTRQTNFGSEKPHDFDPLQASATARSNSNAATTGSESEGQSAFRAAGTSFSGGTPSTLTQASSGNDSLQRSSVAPLSQSQEANTTTAAASAAARSSRLAAGEHDPRISMIEADHARVERATSGANGDPEGEWLTLANRYKQ
ncbi:hypothetical protein I203_105642 [Kwoniella mangroviensis CBS 8507]|uniref:uncharacterized protein n=1 Tax=Kwoniella mangroviensis CBS 8507 TaxID=1296122 RepID=UPI00080D2210|nr:uncharacterized protein I203_01456 [Kwoniella mangroviensis CBS 8507]OCF69592.1 hypothetical protein I203_01456 [Kwoniella mangroviensis CBS 8507]